MNILSSTYSIFYWYPDIPYLKSSKWNWLLGSSLFLVIFLCNFPSWDQQQVRFYCRLKYPPKSAEIIIFYILELLNRKPFICWSKPHYGSFENANFCPNMDPQCWVNVCTLGIWQHYMYTFKQKEIQWLDLCCDRSINSIFLSCRVYNMVDPRFSHNQ